MRLLFYSPNMEGHPQVYCRVLADIFLEEGYQVVIAGGGEHKDWARDWTYLAPLIGHPQVSFVWTNDRSEKREAALRAEELKALQEECAIDSTLLIEGDYFADELRRIAAGDTDHLHGHVAAIFARTSGWYPRENDYGGTPEPLIFGGGLRSTLGRIKTMLFRRKESASYFYNQVVLRRRTVDAIVVKDERVSDHFGSRVHWMPEIFRMFDEQAVPAASASPGVIPDDMQAYIDRAGTENILLYFGTGARYKGYDYFLKLAELDETTFALHAGAPLREADRTQMHFDVDRIREKLLAEGRLFETGGFVEDDRLVQALFQTIDRFVSTHRLTLSSGTMLQALDYGKPVLTAATGQVGYRTKKFNLGQTYGYADPESLRDAWVAFRQVPVARYESDIHSYMQRFSREAVANVFRNVLLPKGDEA